MFRTTTLILVSAGLLFTATMVRADTIPLLQDDDTGAVILNDGFEGSTVGQKPSSPWMGGTYGGSTGSVLTTCDLESEGIAANEGSKYVKLYRPDQSGGVYLQGVGTSANSGDGDTIRLQIAFRVDGVESSIYATSGLDGTAIAEFGLFGNGDVAIVTPDQQDWGILDQKANVGQWNTLVVTHVNGVDAWSVSVNGAAFETRQGFTGRSALAFDGITLQSDSRNSTGYWDASPIPEPGTSITLLTAIVSLLAYAWRRRK